jgi:hypothetical protein
LKYDIVLLGATSVSLGLAKQLKEKYRILIINDTAMIASEFIAAYNLGSNWEYEPKELITKEIKEDLIKRNIMNKNGVSIYSAGSIFYKNFSELECDTLLDTQILSIEKPDSSYEVNIFNCAGHSKIEAAYIIDTTANRISEAEVLKKTLNCVLANAEKDDFPDISLNNIEFVKEQDDKINTVIMKLNCEIKSELFKDRHCLLEVWKQRPEALKKWKIAAIGFCHEVQVSLGFKKIDNNYILMPAAFYANPLIGIDEGIEKGRSVAL